MWKQYIEKLWDDAEFYEPANGNNIVILEQNLSMILPEELKELLYETDGFEANYGNQLILRTSLETKPHERIADINHKMRNTPDFKDLYKPFNDILFIGEDGAGGYFGYTIENSKCTNSIVHWDHEDDSRKVISKTGLKAYLKFAQKMFEE